ncbi:LPS assembly lipoprotein LptE [Massilia sp. TS11]|uniref:LPS-assembly lipoprotein LptE n=1 Tax=Massilia sp. TS11 TaxID=2908003 RepID=UPI001EDB3DE5|nr:LPS assembly lipoprotein LptE [Massilia sp. TS11]MCG2586373.1 LPS assembly lipoprotein LptE [Massilia sp. TS11]
MRALGRWMCALLLAGLLSACGFHLRGADGQFNMPFQSIYLGFPDTSPLGVELKRNLRGVNTSVVSDESQAEARLDVVAENRGKTILSLNSQGRVREYTLSYSLTFRVRDAKGRELLAPTEITLKRTISFNETQTLAKESEEALLYRDMQSDLVQQILRRLAALKTS